jgi:hypothetical protein
MEEEFSNFDDIQGNFPSNNNNPNESLIDFDIIANIQTNHDNNGNNTIINEDNFKNKLEVLNSILNILRSHLNSYLETLNHNYKRLEQPKLDEENIKNIGNKQIKEIFSFNSKNNEDIISNMISELNNDTEIKIRVFNDIINLRFKNYYSSFVSDFNFINSKGLFYLIDTLSDLLEKIEKDELEKLSVNERNTVQGKNKVATVLNEFKTKVLELQNEFQ